MPRVAAVVGDMELPIDVDTSWDADAAAARVAVFASSDNSGDVDTVDWSIYQRAFFHRDDDTDEATFGAYRFGFADIIDGDMAAVAGGLRAVAAQLSDSDLADDERDAIQARVDAYLERIEEMGDEATVRVSPDGDRYTVQTCCAGQWTLPDARRAMVLAHHLARPTVLATNGDGPAFEAVLLVEGVESLDGRTIETAEWRELPLTLFAQTEIAWGHDGAEVAGRIDTIERLDDGTIVARGVFDTGEFGTEIARLVAEQTLRGISVDVGAVSDVRVIVDDDFDPGLPEGGGEVQVPDVPVREVYGTAEIMGATIVAFPAFAESQIKLVDVPDPEVAALRDTVGYLLRDKLTAMAHTPELPPSRVDRDLDDLDARIPALP